MSRSPRIPFPPGKKVQLEKNPEDLTLQAKQQASLNLPLKVPLLQAEQQASLNLPLKVSLLQAKQQA